MSASREKRNRQELASSGWVDPKIAREEEQRRAEKRTNRLYAAIGALLVVVVAVVLLWESGRVFPKATAITVDDEKYSAAEVNFYLQNTYNAFLTQHHTVLDYLSLNPSAALQGQVITATDASILNVPVGSTWHEYFLSEAIDQIRVMQASLKRAEEENFVFPASVDDELRLTMDTLTELAEEEGVSEIKYLRSRMGDAMTMDIYRENTLRSLQSNAYLMACQANMVYTAEELEAEYQANRDKYDLVAYEYVTVDGTIAAVTDVTGTDLITPSEDEKQAALDQAKEIAEELLERWKNGDSLKAGVADYEGIASHYESEGSANYNTTVTKWLFEEGRKAEDSTILQSGDFYYVVVFHDRYKPTYNTVDIRHILIANDESGDMAAETASSVSEAKELLEQWKAGMGTEDSFAALAREVSDDTTYSVGGLRSQVYKGQHVAAFNDWCFDPARKSGDTGVVETTYGAHIMYFIGTNLPRWEAATSETLKLAEATALYEELANSTEVTRKLGLNFL